MRTLSSTGRCRGEHRHKPSSRRSMRHNSSLNHYQEKIFQSKHPSHLRTRRNRRSEFCQDLSKSVCRKSCLQRLDQSDHYCRCRKKEQMGSRTDFVIPQRLHLSNQPELLISDQKYYVEQRTITSILEPSKELELLAFRYAFVTATDEVHDQPVRPYLGSILTREHHPDTHATFP